MAEFIRCDGDCGSESPNSKGLHVANNWMKLWVQRDGGKDFVAYRLCPDCARRDVFLRTNRGKSLFSRETPVPA